MTDVAIIGDGVIGLSTAWELGRAGASVRVIGAAKRGMASEAAAGLLAPTIGELSAAARPFFMASLALYPSFVEGLAAHEAGLSMTIGLLDVSAGARRERGLAHSVAFLTTDGVARFAPQVVAPHGGILHPSEGAIDNVRLMRALRRAVSASPSVTYEAADPARRVELSASHAAVVLDSGERIEAGMLVLAAGAWSTGIGGLPRPLPVTPLKGQMLAVGSGALGCPVVGDDIYLIPRVGEVVIGSTTEEAGFDVGVDPAAIDRLRRAAIAVCPPLGDAPVLRSWAGIRPATPDMLPIIGTDPSHRRLVYACGHAKNGILLAPATAAAVAALVSGKPPMSEAEPFSVLRFGDF